MTKWQILTDMGITIDLIEAITPKFAVEKLREKSNQIDSYYNDYWIIGRVEGNKINLLSAKKTTIKSE